MKTQNTNTAKAATVAKYTAAEIASYAAGLLLKFKSVSAVKAKAPALREKHGPENWAAIFAEIKAIRAKDIDTAADNAKARAFTYQNIMGAVYATLAADKDYTALCKYARNEFKGRDYETAARVVAAYYPRVSASGMPCRKVQYLSTSGRFVYDSYEEIELTKAAALAVLQSALDGMRNAAKKAAKGGKDNATATRENTVTPGVIVAVYAAAKVAGGIIKAGTKYGADNKETAAEIGRPVPTGAEKLATVNADTRAKIKAAMQAAYEATKAAKATAVEKHTAKAAGPDTKAAKAKGKAEKGQGTKAAAKAAAAA